MNLAALYTTQLRVLWEWRGGRKALLKRLLITLIVSTVAFLLTAWLLPGIHVDRLPRRRDRRRRDGAAQRARPAGWCWRSSRRAR